MGVAAGLILLSATGCMAALFWLDPDRGLRETMHRAEFLPRVLADRYAAFAVLAALFTWFLWRTGEGFPLACLMAVCVLMGATDGAIYAVAGQPHWKHTGSAVLSALGFALVVWG